MSASPPKDDHDAEPSVHSGEEAEHMDRDQEGAQQGLIDFEVKEQDRWLPIANGKSDLWTTVDCFITRCLLVFFFLLFFFSVFSFPLVTVSSTMLAAATSF